MRKIYQPGRSNVLSNNAMVATSQPLSSQEAINILKLGGNAVDAAIAASAVLSVVEPGSTGIGGDCFSIIKMNNKKAISINGSGKAPKKANLDYFKSNKIDSIGLLSPHSVTIPGAVDAWYEMHKKFGKLEFEKLFTTAIYYARDGFPVHEIEAFHWQKTEEKLTIMINEKIQGLEESIDVKLNAMQERHAGEIDKVFHTFEQYFFLCSVIGIPTNYTLELEEISLAIKEHV